MAQFAQLEPAGMVHSLLYEPERAIDVVDDDFPKSKDPRTRTDHEVQGDLEYRVTVVFSSKHRRHSC